MKSFSVFFSLATVASVAQAAVLGFDISNYQSSVDFGKAYADGARFVYIKATEGTTFIDKKFGQHYTGATNAGLIRGGYHFARPASSSGAAQAKFFLQHGGGWSSDGITLPGLVDLEYQSSSSTCGGVSQSAMVSWISDFVETYHGSTGVFPVIYTTTDWWKQCTGNTASFATKCPLMIARYGSSVGELPAGWKFYTIWQYNDSSKWGGDSNTFNGDFAQLQKLARG